MHVNVHFKPTEPHGLWDACCNICTVVVGSWISHTVVRHVTTNVPQSCGVQSTRLKVDYHHRFKSSWPLKWLTGSICPRFSSIPVDNCNWILFIHFWWNTILFQTTAALMHYSTDKTFLYKTEWIKQWTKGHICIVFKNVYCFPTVFPTSRSSQSSKSKILPSWSSWQEVKRSTESMLKNAQSIAVAWHDQLQGTTTTANDQRPNAHWSLQGVQLFALLSGIICAVISTATATLSLLFNQLKWQRPWHLCVYDEKKDDVFVVDACDVHCEHQAPQLTSDLQCSVQSSIIISNKIIIIIIGILLMLQV